MELSGLSLMRISMKSSATASITVPAAAGEVQAAGTRESNVARAPRHLPELVDRLHAGAIGQHGISLAVLARKVGHNTHREL